MSSGLAWVTGQASVSNENKKVGSEMAGDMDVRHLLERECKTLGGNEESPRSVWFALVPVLCLSPSLPMRYARTRVAHVGAQVIIADTGILHALCQKTWATQWSI